MAPENSEPENSEYENPFRISESLQCSFVLPGAARQGKRCRIPFLYFEKLLNQSEFRFLNKMVKVSKVKLSKRELLFCFCWEKPAKTEQQITPFGKFYPFDIRIIKLREAWII